MRQGNININQSHRAAHSQALDLLRFPLAIVVLAVHVFDVHEVFVYGKHYEFAGTPVFDILYNFVHSFLSEYSLTIYFFISGYVFFLGISDFDSVVYKRKLRNRVKTLLIPFVVWNVLAVLIELSYFFPPLSALRPGLDFSEVDFSVSNILQTFWDCRYGVFEHVYPADTTSTVFFPQNPPLWFLRILMVMALLTPVLYKVIKKYGMGFVVATYVAWFCAYLSQYGPAVEFATALFPFSFGAFMSISRRDMMGSFGRHFKSSTVIYLSLSALQFVELTCGGTSAVYLATKALTAPAALVFAYNMSAWLLRRHVCKVVPLLASASFFIYVAPYLFVGNAMKVIVYLVRPEGQFATFLVYASVLVLIATGLLGLFWVMQKATPQLLKFIAGRK